MSGLIASLGRRRTLPRLRRIWPLGLGLLLLVGFWAGPLPDRARLSFSAHMILHLGVMVLAAPLIAAGLARLYPLSNNAPVLGLALAGSLTDLLVVWTWHLPSLHEASSLSPRIFALQQASFLAAGILVWAPGLAATGRAAAAGGTIAMLMSFAHMSMLGVLLSMAPRLIYAPEVCLGGFGLGPLDDQRLGGVLMATLGAFPYLLGGLIFGRRLLRDVGHAEAN